MERFHASQPMGPNGAASSAREGHNESVRPALTSRRPRVRRAKGAPPSLCAAKGAPSSSCASYEGKAAPSSMAPPSSISPSQPLFSPIAEIQAAASRPSPSSRREAEDSGRRGQVPPPPAASQPPSQLACLLSFVPMAGQLLPRPLLSPPAGVADEVVLKSIVNPPPRPTGALSTNSQKGKMMSSVRKRKAPMEKHKVPEAKKLRSPIVTMIVRSPGVRMMLSPKPSSPSGLLPSTSQVTRRRKLRSEIWKDFEPIYDGKTIAEAQCLHCHKIFKVNCEVGTSSCLRHLHSCEGKAKLDHMLDRLNPNGLSLPDASLKDWKFDQETSRDELVKLVVAHALPFSVVEYPKFRSFVSSLNPWFTHISRTTIKSDCVSSYEDCKGKLRAWLNQLSSRVSLTADLWTSKQTLGYLCVTCHFITADWKIHKRVIKFGLVETPHDGRNLFNAMLRCITEWNLENKIFSVTLDNAQVNDNFMKSLKENLLGKQLLLADGAMFHCRSGCHVFNIAVQEGLKMMSDAVSTIRESVKYVKSSQGRKQRFEKMIKEVGISCQKRPPLDVATRWNSTFHMLSCALEYKRAFESLTTEDIQYTHEPLVEEWNMARKLCNILGVFYTGTNILSSCNYPTSCLYFHQIWEVKKL
ncbi:hypothetical protein BS78_07G110500 [Paspalum vaginatum]|nr:hypothetical protein BS78_07G110500 [Paspalum vaginatum]